jgi:hypothetical protein
MHKGGLLENYINIAKPLKLVFLTYEKYTE